MKWKTPSSVYGFFGTKTMLSCDFVTCDFVTLRWFTAGIFGL